MHIGAAIFFGWVALLVVYLSIRNIWVYNQRIKMIDRDFNTYMRLPSYNAMMVGHGFWRWDIEYFIKLGDGR